MLKNNKKTIYLMGGFGNVLFQINYGYFLSTQGYDKDTSKINKARIKKGKYIEGTNYVIMEQTLSSGSLIPKTTYEKVAV
jgi:hypothetical protein